MVSLRVSVAIFHTLPEVLWATQLVEPVLLFSPTFSVVFRCQTDTYMVQIVGLVDSLFN